MEGVWVQGGAWAWRGHTGEVHGGLAGSRRGGGGGGGTEGGNRRGAQRERMVYFKNKA